jgi:endonuclease/exonuclease/phosphatase family metal-dependent hydrolase
MQHVLPRTLGSRHRDRIATSVWIIAWIYLTLVVGMAGLLWFAGDRWWPATLLTFGPRWIALVPLPVLVPPALLFRRSAFVPLVGALVVSVGPIMGLCLSWRGVAGPPLDASGDGLRVLTCNVGGGARRSALADFIGAENPDIVALVEAGGDCEELFEPREEWHFSRDGGNLIASRLPIVRSEPLRSDRLVAWNRPALRCEIEAPRGKVQVLAVHLETPREGLEAVMHGRWRGAAEMERTTAIRRIESELASAMAADGSGPAIVAGDFNMPVDSTLYQQYWSAWQNALSAAGLGFCQTKFTSRFGARIDHILANHDWEILSARVGPQIGGDHRPVVADLRLK